MQYGVLVYKNETDPPTWLQKDGEVVLFDKHIDAYQEAASQQQISGAYHCLAFAYS